MCIQITDAAPKSIPNMVLVEAPPLQSLPACVKSSPRFDAEHQRLIEAELCLRAAARHAETARYAQLEEALSLAEAQVARPFQILLWADERYAEEHDAALLDGEEVEALTYFIGDVQLFRREKRFPYFDAADCEIIARLHAKYADAIAEKRGLCDDPEEEPLDHSFSHIWRHMIAANSEAVRSAE